MVSTLEGGEVKREAVLDEEWLEEMSGYGFSTAPSTPRVLEEA